MVTPNLKTSNSIHLFDGPENFGKQLSKKFCTYPSVSLIVIVNTHA